MLSANYFLNWWSFMQVDQEIAFYLFSRYLAPNSLIKYTKKIEEMISQYSPAQYGLVRLKFSGNSNET